METYNRICFERPTQEFYTLFDYNLQEGSKLKILNINIFQSKYGISIDQIYHIMKNTIQEYWVLGTPIQDPQREIPLRESRMRFPL